ncbi:hypothetical protein HBB16_08230 [Pseudonocardia sp. MCCB 268]|nr:hypothetical protein [Pseudonocardia cytotoxica]
MSRSDACGEGSTREQPDQHRPGIDVERESVCGRARGLSVDPRRPPGSTAADFKSATRFSAGVAGTSWSAQPTLTTVDKRKWTLLGQVKSRLRGPPLLLSHLVERDDTA